jgi:hypothetical protein
LLTVLDNEGAEELPWTDGAERAATTRTSLDTETETLAPFFTDPQLKITDDDLKVCDKEEVSASGSGMTLDQLRTYGDQISAREFVSVAVASCGLELNFIGQRSRGVPASVRHRPGTGPI